MASFSALTPLTSGHGDYRQPNRLRFRHGGRRSHDRRRALTPVARHCVEIVLADETSDKPILRSMKAIRWHESNKMLALDLPIRQT